MEPLVSVCIIHYGIVDYLKKAIDSVKNSTYWNLEIIVIDNNGESQAPLSPHDLGLDNTQYTYMRNLQNKGFAEGCNQGLRLAEGKYIFILNNDIEIDTDCIRVLVEAAEKDPEVGILQPKMLDFNERRTFHSSAAGGFLDIFGYPFARGRILDSVEQDTGQYDNAVEICWASGAAMFGRKNVLIEAGCFDPDFFMYMEEVDLAWRVRLLGSKVVYIPDISIYHIGCPHLGRGDEKRMYFNHRNSLIMLMKNLSGLNLIVIFPLRICLELITLIGSLFLLRTTRAIALIKSFRYILMNINMIKSKRRRVQCRRKTGDKIIFSLFYQNSIAIAYYIMRKKKMSELRKMKTHEYKGRLNQ